MNLLAQSFGMAPIGVSIVASYRVQSGTNVFGLLPVQLLLPFRVDRVCTLPGLRHKPISTWIVQDVVHVLVY
jgi:hypothetical protein